MRGRHPFEQMTFIVRRRSEGEGRILLVCLQKGVRIFISRNGITEHRLNFIVVWLAAAAPVTATEDVQEIRGGGSVCVCVSGRVLSTERGTRSISSRRLLAQLSMLIN